MLTVLASLLYVYAGLPESVIVQEEATGKIIANREFFFYAVATILLIINVLIYIMSKVYRQDEDFLTWFNGLIITINIFFIISMSLIQLYNSQENFNFSRIGFVIYGGVALVVIWALSWPIYVLFRKIYPKPIIS
jgi:cytochrome c biogenesis factor